jgi:hypothetical protein
VVKQLPERDGSVPLPPADLIDIVPQGCDRSQCILPLPVLVN